MITNNEYYKTNDGKYIKIIRYWSDNSLCDKLYKPQLEIEIRKIKCDKNGVLIPNIKPIYYTAEEWNKINSEENIKYIEMIDKYYVASDDTYSSSMYRLENSCSLKNIYNIDKNGCLNFTHHFKEIMNNSYLLKDGNYVKNIFIE